MMGSPDRIDYEIFRYTSRTRTDSKPARNVAVEEIDWMGRRSTTDHVRAFVAALKSFTPAVLRVLS